MILPFEMMGIEAVKTKHIGPPYNTMMYRLDGTESCALSVIANLKLNAVFIDGCVTIPNTLAGDIKIPHSHWLGVMKHGDKGELIILSDKQVLEH